LRWCGLKLSISVYPVFALQRHHLAVVWIEIKWLTDKANVI